MLAFFASAVSKATSADVFAIFLQYGVLGAFAVIALAFFRTVYKRETERADRAELALAELNRDVRTMVIPVLTECSRAIADAATALQRRPQR